MTLRVLRDGQQEPPGPPGTNMSKEDPRVAALVSRFTQGTALGGKFLFTADDAEILRRGLNGVAFSDHDLVAIEKWLRDHDLYGRPHTIIGRYVHELDCEVEQQLGAVAHSRWLKEPLDRFMISVSEAKKEGVHLPHPKYLRAVFNAFLTVRT